MFGSFSQLAKHNPRWYWKARENIRNHRTPRPWQTAFRCAIDRHIFNGSRKSLVLSQTSKRKEKERKWRREISIPPILRRPLLRDSSWCTHTLSLPHPRTQTHSTMTCPEGVAWKIWASCFGHGGPSLCRTIPCSTIFFRDDYITLVSVRWWGAVNVEEGASYLIATHTHAHTHRGEKRVWVRVASAGISVEPSRFMLPCLLNYSEKKSYLLRLHSIQVI